MKAKRKRILSILLVVGVLLGAVAGIAALAGRNKADEGFELVKPDFERGGLNSNGKYTETNESIYTKEAFECGEGVRVKLEFDSNVLYEIYFYDESDNFIEKSRDGYTKTETVSAPEGATHARIVVTPVWDPDTDADDREIGFFGVNKYAKQLTIMIAPAKDAK